MTTTAATAAGQRRRRRDPPRHRHRRRRLARHRYGTPSRLRATSASTATQRLRLQPRPPPRRRRRRLCSLRRRRLPHQDRRRPAGRRAAPDAAAFTLPQRSAPRLHRSRPILQAAVRGRRAVGEPCAGSTLCAPGLYCAYDPQAEGECREACAARRAPGETCEYDEQCAHDGDRVGFCRRADALADEGICATYALRGGAAVGQPCGLVTDGDAYARVNCREGAWCDATEDDAAGTCQTIPGPGQPCVDTEFPCRGGICLNQICVALQVVNAAGSPCDLRQFQICNPLQGLVCLDGACVASQGGAGQPCTDDDFGGVGCQDGLYCNDDGLCAAALADGEACDPDGGGDACQSGDCLFDPATGDGTCGADVDPCL
ncbi:MAG: hypothetical protein H6705_10220 [Myxococcales bacterium]|nr:hypothetical protein [Myxococcales bacterium]